MIFIHEAVGREKGRGFCAAAPAVVLASTVLVW
jgi:hypothetical protein